MTINPKKIRTKLNKSNLFIVTTPSIEEEIMHKKNQNYISTKTLSDKTTTANSNNYSITTNNYNNYQKEYLNEIYLNLLLDEKNFEKKINPKYLSFQKGLNEKMRAILIDWIMEICYHYNFLKKTLFQCVFIIDAFLSKNILDKSKLQLLGIASLLLSFKENEVIYPSLDKLIQLTDNAYTVQELTNMERKIILSLNFDILAPTSEEFFEINAAFFNFSEKQKIFGEYFLECSLIDYNMLKYKQSTIGISCGYLAMKYFNMEGLELIIDNANFGINAKEIINCVKELCFFVKSLNDNSSLGVVRNINVDI